MSVEGPNKPPMAMASRQWSTDTLNQGVEAIKDGVKQEPWIDTSDDAALKERLKAGFSCDSC